MNDQISGRFLSDKAPSREFLEKKFPEWCKLEAMLKELESFGQVHHLGQVQKNGVELPLIALSFGSIDPKAPVLGLFGGFHGLERIGSQVVLALMQSFSELSTWDQMVHHALSKIRIIFFPIVNPFGISHRTRSNANGVDLMRNAPIQAVGKVTPLVGGQTFSNKLPWFRGTGSLEPENEAVLKFCREQFFQSEAVVTVDFHSGFGVQDQIWFPYAKTTAPYPHLAETYLLMQNFERTFPNHFYKIEPMAKNYTIHGDVWDYIYDLFLAENKGVFIPLALEMGSWMWVKKNPLQIFNPLGHYNPMKPHRQKRILRRHMTFFDYLIRALASPKSWTTLQTGQRGAYETRAKDLWYQPD